MKCIGEAPVEIATSCGQVLIVVIGNVEINDQHNQRCGKVIFPETALW
jgi:hypothetical protein